MQKIHTIHLSDAEVIALEDAIKVYKNFIDKEIGSQIKAPYWARLQSIKNLEEKLKQ